VTTLSQRSFSAGEISPSLYARVDLVKYATGLRTCRNNIILRYGGVANRPGTKFVCEVNDSSFAVRLIPFVFNADQTYVLEFGDVYMRVIKDGAQVTYTEKVITGITQANPAVVTIAGHGYSNGDEVYINSVAGMTQVNNRNFKIANVTANTFELTDITGLNNINSTSYTAYSSGGTAAKVYQISTPYTTAYLPYLNYVQSGDVITIASPDVPPYELSRTGDTSWTMSLISFAPDQAAPTALSGSAGGAGGNTYRYKVTAVNEETGEESLVATATATTAISAITKADPCVVTSNSHGIANGEEIYLSGIVGMTELNGRRFIANNVATNTLELLDVDSTNYTTYTSGGTIQKAFVKLTSAAAPSTSAPHTITWTVAADAEEYNIYKESNGVYGQIGVASGTSFLDINITPNASYTPPTTRNPFIGTGNYPSTVTYIQQRLAFASTDNDTEKIWLSRTGNFKNFTTSSPSQSDDAITFTMAGRQVNEVKSLLDLGRLVILTSGGEFSAEGDGGVLTPTTINLRQSSYNGSGLLQPLLIDNSALYQQARGSIIRDLIFNFDNDGYVGNDLSIFSSHLFDKYTFSDWAYQQIPHSIVWVVRSDGVLLGMTYVKSQQVVAWHIHDTQGGLFENVVVVPEGNEDVVYTVVNRTINGRSARYIERLTSRQVVDVVDNIFMDSALTYDGRNTGGITMTLSGGSTWVYTETLTLTASGATFASTDIGNEIHLTGADGEVIRAEITAYTSSTVVSVLPNRTVPASLRTTATLVWTRAVDEVAGLWHLEGEDVSVFADEFVVASPFNDAYTTVTVANGKITLDKPYGVIHVGLPYKSDVETLDIDSPNGESLVDKSKLVGKVTLFVEDTRGIWCGPKPPSDDDTDPLESLVEFKIRNEEGYESPVDLKTGDISVMIEPHWNSNGRVFIRQVDPIPMTILSINPSGKFPF